MQNMIKTSTFQYRFIGKGATVEVEEDQFIIRYGHNGKEQRFSLDSTVILDVGNKLTYGIVDHHHLKSPINVNGKEVCSATGILSAYPSLLSKIDRSKPITIFVHAFPDFDCYASVYLASFYIQHGHFPQDYELLVDYAEKIDAGEQGVDFNQICTPYTISLVIGDVIDNQFDNSISFARKNELMMEKGLLLVEYMMSKLNSFQESEKCVDHPIILDANHPFQDEQNLLNKDYEKYEADIEDETICEKRSMYLLNDNRSQKVVEVDALFWNQTPKCSLHKLWARADTRSPSKTGYVFTFIPGIVEMDNNFKLETNRVTISVNPHFNVTLGELGKILEFAEQKREKEVFKNEDDSLKQWRDQGRQRWKDEWCINYDPWYDGRSHDYTIIDSPNIGSLLQIDEIKDITLNFSKPKVKNYYNKVLFPITFEADKYKEIVASFEDNHHFLSGKLLENETDIKYFRPYIQDYLFNIDGDTETTESYCKVYTIKLKINAGMKDSTLENIVKINKVDVILFKYGIGFLAVEVGLNPSFSQVNTLLFEEILDINKRLSSGIERKEFLAFFNEPLNSTKLDLKNCEKGLMFTHLTLDGHTVFEGLKKEMVYKFTNLMDWGHPIEIEKDYMQENIKKMFLEIDDDYVFGFSKEGAAFLEFDQGVSNLIAEKRDKKVEKRDLIQHQFYNTDFVIFLLVVQQRYSLMEFSKQLSRYGTQKHKISQLREVMLEFITHGWFSQITNDETGMQKFKKWNLIFETEQLHNEVIDQVSTIDEFHRGNNSKKIELMSAVFFPVVLVNLFAGIGYFDFVGSLLTVSDGTRIVLWIILTLMIVGGGFWVSKFIKYGKS
ncbi:hypothetical protein [Alkalihalobacterium alkalinitrilicum]|uniref:hypothetical protein n=1 Tax=Alkalihalobacterium alkalinitrilicum TaxID=427920 RepID=UPI000994A5CC|nr:hypothetical protein [Alkalihalobacterium alkalinitrilicum]